VDDERAETYLRLRAEAELRRAGDQLRALDAAAGTDPGMSPFATAEGAQWTVIRAGRILVAAGALDQECLDRIAGDLDAAIKVWSRLLLNWDRRRGRLHRGSFIPPSPRPPSGPAGNWHVAMPGEPWTFPDGTQAFSLRLTPPLAAVPDTAEVVITGPATQVRVAIPVRPTPPAGGRAASGR
jgi:hypothetical protein